MRLAKMLDIRPGVTAVIGGGGKTTLLRMLGEELTGKGSVLLCTTTKIWPFSDMPCAHSLKELDELRKSNRILCAGRVLPENGKLSALDVPTKELVARFQYVLVEADGSAGRPMKAHAPHEPVIPAEANQTICVVGASGFWHPVYEVAHRPERYAALAGVSVEEELTPEIAATVLKKEALQDRIFVNQVESLPELLDAKTMALLLDRPVLAGSLQRGEIFQC